MLEKKREIVRDSRDWQIKESIGVRSAAKHRKKTLLPINKKKKDQGNLFENVKIPLLFRRLIEDDYLSYFSFTCTLANKSSLLTTDRSVGRKKKPANFVHFNEKFVCVNLPQLQFPVGLESVRSRIFSSKGPELVSFVKNMPL